ncbi:MAG: homocysteine S-methyltransferase family protein, partial [Rikenellaceae bacterium]
MSFEVLKSLLQERILLLDGAMGTMIQRHGLGEGDFRGEEFTNWGCELNGCNDILAITKPEILSDIHRQYLAAGADIITTCSFNAHPVSLKDYGLESRSYDIARAAAEVARAVADEFTLSNPTKRRWVAGSMGPTNRTASISADVENPAAREVNFDQLVEGYTIQLNGLLDGGADIILIETIFDSLNAKAALYAIDYVGEERGRVIPTMASGTIADASGRILAGQSVEAMYNSLSHAKLISVGLNCAFGARQMMPYLEQLAAIAGCAVSAHPNAGLPNVMGGYYETPEMFADD